MTESCAAWASRLVRTDRWNADRAWVASQAEMLRRHFPEAWDSTIEPADRRVPGARGYTTGYLSRIIHTLEVTRQIVTRMAGHLNLSPVWIVPPPFRYPTEPGFVSFGSYTSGSSVSSISIEGAPSLHRRVRALVADGHGTTDSAGTLYTRGGTCFLDPLVGWQPAAFWFGNRPIVPGWKGGDIDRARATGELVKIWQTLDRPDAPYCWWNSPSATFWPTAPISSATSRTDASRPSHQVIVSAQRAGNIDDGWGAPNVTGSFMSTPVMPSPWCGPYTSLRYAHRVLSQIASQDAFWTLKRAIAELAEWKAGVLRLGREELLEYAARTGTNVSSDVERANEKIRGVTRLAGTVATAAATAVNPLLGAAVALAIDIFFTIGSEPGSVTGARGYPPWPGRVAWYSIPISEGQSARGLGPWPLWRDPPPDGLVCDDFFASAAPGGDKKDGAPSRAPLVIGGALAAGAVAAIAIAIAKAGR